MVHDANGSTGTFYTPGFGEREVNGGTTTDSFFHGDWLGNTRYLSADDGSTFPNTLRYDAFGRVVAQVGGYYPTPFMYGGGNGYKSEYRSDTEPGVGLQYLQQRYYDPSLGRFISPDPIGIEGGLNLYGYCHNDPVNRTDPSGTEDKNGNGVDDSQDGGGAFGGFRPENYDLPNGPSTDVPGLENGINYANAIPCSRGSSRGRGGGLGGWFRRMFGNERGRVLVPGGGGAPAAAPRPQRYDGPKPRYEVNNQHVAGRGLRRNKTPLPRDAEEVYRRAVPDDDRLPSYWWGRNGQGQVYRFSPSNTGAVHFSGILGVGDSTRNITPYARQRLERLER